MLEVYSSGLSVDSGNAIPLNNVTLQKGCTAENSAPATIQLNKCGVYAVKVDAYAQAAEAGDITIQLSKNDVLQPQAISTVTGAVGETDVLHFDTLVQVTENNTCCCCTSPTRLRLINSGVGVTDLHINVCVTKVC